MYRVASLHAFDVFETIHVSATVTLWDGIQTGSPTGKFTVSAVVQGAGSSEDLEWLRDALVGLIEAM